MKVFRITQNFQGGVLELNFAGRWPSKSKIRDPFYVTGTWSVVDKLLNIVQ